GPTPWLRNKRPHPTMIEVGICGRRPRAMGDARDARRVAELVVSERRRTFVDGFVHELVATHTGENGLHAPPRSFFHQRFETVEGGIEDEIGVVRVAVPDFGRAPIVA